MNNVKLGFRAFLLSLSVAFALTSGLYFSAQGSYTPDRFVPAATILAFGGASAPTGFLICDGTSYLRLTYPNLASAFGCSGTACAYGAADASHFNVPDLRGRFLRGSDNMGTGAASRDAGTRSAMATGGNTSGVGSIEGQATAVNGLHDTGHTHPEQFSNNNSGSSGTIFSFTTGVLNSQISNGISTASGTANLAGDSETRPINADVNYIIKF